MVVYWIADAKPALYFNYSSHIFFLLVVYKKNMDVNIVAGYSLLLASRAEYFSLSHFNKI